jgi:hypothetical protein
MVYYFVLLFESALKGFTYRYYGVRESLSLLMLCRTQNIQFAQKQKGSEMFQRRGLWFIYRKRNKGPLLLSAVIVEELEPV